MTEVMISLKIYFSQKNPPELMFKEKYKCTYYYIAKQNILITSLMNDQ